MAMVGHLLCFIYAVSIYPGSSEPNPAGLAPEKGKQTKIWGNNARVIVRVEPEP